MNNFSFPSSGIVFQAADATYPQPGMKRAFRGTVEHLHCLIAYRNQQDMVDVKGFQTLVA